MHFQPGRRDDQIGLDFLAGFQLEAGFGETLDLVGDDRGGAIGECVEEIAVRCQAEALVPGIIARREMLSDVELAAQPNADRLEDLAFDQVGIGLGQLINIDVQQHILRPSDRIGDLLGQDFAHEIGETIA